jgi:hypothetical protein
MTTTNTYNPIFRAFRELTTPEAFRWYGTQAKTTATLAKTIAFRSITTAQRLLSDSFAQRFRHRFAIAPAIAEPENAKATHPVVQDDRKPVAVLEDAMLTLPESALEQEYAPAIDEPETVEGDYHKHFPGLRIGNTPEEQLELNRPAMDLLPHWIDEDKIDEPEQADTRYEAIAPAEAQTIAPAIEPEPELDDSKCDHIANDEPQQAIAGEADAELSGADEALLDDKDDTELRP